MAPDLSRATPASFRLRKPLKTNENSEPRFKIRHFANVYSGSQIVI